MIRYILDTDHISLFQRVRATPPQEIAATVITLEEQLYGRLNRNSDRPQALNFSSKWYLDLLDWKYPFPCSCYCKVSS